jgi:hypothetical protein
MKIGIIVDGDSEYGALPALLRRVATESGHTYPKVTKAHVHPMAPLPVIARECKSVLGVFEGRGFDRILVILDREDRGECPGALARDLCALMSGPTHCTVGVVIKDRCFENWLVADQGAMASQPGRFAVTQATRRRVEPNKADSVDATLLIRTLVKGRYEKVTDSKRILIRAEPGAMARHSRSFRRFMRELGHPSYSGQSAVAVRRERT